MKILFSVKQCGSTDVYNEGGENKQSLEGRRIGSHTGLRIIPVTKSQNGKPHNS